MGTAVGRTARFLPPSLPIPAILVADGDRWARPTLRPGHRRRHAARRARPGTTPSDVEHPSHGRPHALPGSLRPLGRLWTRGRCSPPHRKLAQSPWRTPFGPERRSGRVHACRGPAGSCPPGADRLRPVRTAARQRRGVPGHADLPFQAEDSHFRARLEAEGVSHRTIRGPAVLSGLEALRDLHRAQWEGRSQFLSSFDRFVAGCAGGIEFDEVVVHQLATDDLVVATVLVFEVADAPARSSERQAHRTTMEGRRTQPVCVHNRRRVCSRHHRSGLPPR